MQLSSIKEKLSLPLVLFILLYLVVAVVFLVSLSPARNEVGRLQAEIEQLNRGEQNLLRIVEQRPQLERTQREIKENIVSLAQDIPSQYDLFEVLEVLTKLGTSYGITIDTLAHIPLKVTQGSSNGVIPLNLEISGDQGVFSYILQMQKVVPSLQLVEVVLNYAGKERFQAEVKADLRVFVLDDAMTAQWEVPQIIQAEKVNLSGTTFGLPFEIIAQFFNRNVQVLGVVDGGSQSSALLSKDGVKGWFKVGDRLGEAIVSSIFPGGVFLDVDGVQLKLTIGG